MLRTIEHDTGTTWYRVMRWMRPFEVGNFFDPRIYLTLTLVLLAHYRCFLIATLPCHHSIHILDHVCIMIHYQYPDVGMLH